MSQRTDDFGPAKRALERAHKRVAACEDRLARHQRVHVAGGGTPSVRLQRSLAAARTRLEQVRYGR